MKRVPSGLCFIYHSLWQGDGFRRASAHFLALRGHPRKLDHSLVLAALSHSWGRNYLACVDLHTASTFTEVAKPAQENFSSVGEIPFQGSMTQLLILTFPDLMVTLPFQLLEWTYIVLKPIVHSFYFISFFWQVLNPTSSLYGLCGTSSLT